MTRPSQNTDKKLIRAALELLPSTGYSGLKMRKVAQRAGVNLGMFHYHFKNKDDFIARVASEFYEAFYEKFTLEAASGENPKEQLRRALRTLARFAQENRKLLLALGRDILEGHEQTIRLVENFLPRHGVIIVNLIRQCQKQGLILNVPLPVAISFLLGSMVGPIILVALLENIRLKQPYDLIKKVGIPFMLSDRVVGQRLDLIFRALEPGIDLEKLNKSQERKIDEVLQTIFRYSKEDKSHALAQVQGKAKAHKIDSPKRKTARRRS